MERPRSAEMVVMGGIRVAARAYKGRTSLLRTVGNLQVTPVLTQDGRYLQVTAGTCG